MLTNPLLEGIESGGVEGCGAYSTELFGADQAALFEQFQVLSYCSKGDIQRLGQSRNGMRAISEFLDDGPAIRIAQGLEHPRDLDLSFCHVCNRAQPYRSCDSSSARSSSRRRQVVSNASACFTNPRCGPESVFSVSVLFSSRAR